MPLRWSRIDEPVMSPGSMSGVHCTRWVRGVDRLGDGAGQDGLAGAGNVLEQDVAFAQDGDEGQANYLVLALQHRLDVLDDLVEVLLERFERSAIRIRA